MKAMEIDHMVTIALTPTMEELNFQELFKFSVDTSIALALDDS